MMICESKPYLLKENFNKVIPFDDNAFKSKLNQYSPRFYEASWENLFFFIKAKLHKNQILVSCEVCLI